MIPTFGFDPISAVQQAILGLLSVYEGQFVAIGHQLFLAFATILLAWHGITMMFSPRPTSEALFGLARLLLFISFGYAMIQYYDVPIPGLGTSFSNLVTDQTGYLASLIGARSIQEIQETLSNLWSSLEQPDAWSILANLLYWTLLIVIALAQFAVMFVVSFGLIATAVCILLGPLFVPFFIVPTLEWIFWGWLKAFIQYAFMPVVANAFIYLFGTFVSRYLQTLPDGLPVEAQMLYGIHAVMILVTFTVGVLLVPSLTNSIFSGRSGLAATPTAAW